MGAEKTADQCTGFWCPPKSTKSHSLVLVRKAAIVAPALVCSCSFLTISLSAHLTCKLKSASTQASFLSNLDHVRAKPLEKRMTVGTGAINSARPEFGLFNTAINNTGLKVRND